MFQRVLGGQHVKRAAKRAMLSGHGHLLFLHRLQQGRLGARARAVDFVGHQQLTEHRPFDKPEVAGAIGGGVQHLGADNVRRHQIRGELNAVAVQAHHRCDGGHKAGFAKPRQPHEQPMATRQERGKCQLNHLFLTYEL